MKRDKDTVPHAEGLRQRAEKTYEEEKLPCPAEEQEDDERLSHELQVHQIELRIRNEELRQAHPRSRPL